MPGLDLPDFDLPSLARGYGCRAEIAGTPDEVADRRRVALLHDGPTVIEVPIDPKAPPLL